VIRPSINAVAETYDLAQRNPELATALSPFTGERINRFLHIADAPREIPNSREGMVRIARDERLYPGEGDIDIGALVDRLPPVTYSIELPNLKRVAELGFEGHARRCLDAARQCLEARPHAETSTRQYAI